MVTVTYIKFIYKTFVFHEILYNYPAIEFYYVLINKGIKVTQIQNRSWFVVTVFGDRKKTCNVVRGSSFLDSPDFTKFEF